jgi:uncharacterized membrane protein
MNRKLRSRRDLTYARRWTSRWRVRGNTDLFIKVAERLVFHFGTAAFLAIQTTVMIAWITINVWGLSGHFDGYPFKALNLVFSVEAAYAAPFILVAENEQFRRSRVRQVQKRESLRQVQAQTEYLAIELASLRLALSGSVTGSDLRDSFKSLVQRTVQIAGRVEAVGSPPVEVGR